MLEPGLNFQDLLENLSRKQTVLIGTDNITSSFVNSAYARGFNNFAVSGQSRDVPKIAKILGNNFGLVPLIGSSF